MAEHEPPGSYGIEAAVRKITQALDHSLLQVRRDIQAGFDRLERKLDTMPSQKDLDDAVQGVIDGVNKLGTDMVGAIDALKQKIGSGVDPTQDITNLQNTAQQLADLDAQAAAELPPAPGGKK